VQLLSNPVYIGLIITALALLASVLVPVAIYLKQKSKKEISYRVITNVALFNIKDEVRENFEVRFRGLELQNASFVSVTVWNSGNAPIEEADFIDPISISFGQDARIIFFNIGTKPFNILGKYAGTEKECVEFKPRLFNKGYWIEVSAMLTEFSGNVHLEGLVKGVHSLKNANYPSVASLTNPSWNRIYILSLLVAQTCLLFAGLSFLNSFGPIFFEPASNYPSSNFQLIAFILLICFFFSGFCALELYLTSKAYRKISKADDSYIENVFSAAMEKFAEEARQLAAQEQAQTNRQSSTTKKVPKSTT